MTEKGLILTINSTRVTIRQKENPPATYSDEARKMLGIACLKLFKRVCLKI